MGFITNASDKKLKDRIEFLISHSEELRWLVGFFYFSGWETVVESLKANSHVKLRVLVGLEVGHELSQLLEYGRPGNLNLSPNQNFDAFMTSLRHALNDKSQDTQRFYNDTRFFLQMMQEGRLVIRKTRDPNHAKLYLFSLKGAAKDFVEDGGEFITGSSNLTRSGLDMQREFNVEIRDYGFDEAGDFFEELWDSAVEITENAERCETLIHWFENESQAAEVTPFEAYVRILKTYLDLQSKKRLKTTVENLLERNGFKKYSYQLDAANQALSVLEQNNGVIIADVVGLGKSVIASMVAKNLGTKGLIICPPALIGDAVLQTGWEGYAKQFELHGWTVESRGKVQQLAERLRLGGDDYDTVIVDEAHGFRNQDTADYEALTQICRGKNVILLTATPFNNRPEDIFSLLKLFIIPGRSPLGQDTNLEAVFARFNTNFRNYATILKNYDSHREENRQKALEKYKEVIEEAPTIDVDKVRKKMDELGIAIKELISPVLIRRNRIDLQEDRQYRQEVGALAEVNPPEELFYELTPEQSQFYDRVIEEYFGEEGRFTGAIYRPAVYEKTIITEEDVHDEQSRRIQQQRNLYGFMRRLLVKRFESSFGAFEQSIQRFIAVHDAVLQFITDSGGRFILDRALMEKMDFEDAEEVDEILRAYEQGLTSSNRVKDRTVYQVYEFERSKEFLSDIKSDLALLKEIHEEIIARNLVEDDPKRKAITKHIATQLEREPERKIIIFSEYVDTVRHLAKYIQQRMAGQVLVCDGTLTEGLKQQLESNFNAQYVGHDKENQFQVLITSDKLAEGINLNEAGTVVNYDIPWNPTRVIQRVGRINRIGTKKFDNLYIYNFFPSEQGATIDKSREIATQKMFMIHKALGEDVQIFDADEEPTASGLFQRIQAQPNSYEEPNLITKIRNEYEQIKASYPNVVARVEKLPNRVKTAKPSDKNELHVLHHRGLSLYARRASTESKSLIETIPFKTLLDRVKCTYETQRLELSEGFWEQYERADWMPSDTYSQRPAGNSIEGGALEGLETAKVLLKSDKETMDFIQTLIDDLTKYHTMPRHTLRRLKEKGGLKASDTKGLKEFEKIVKRIKSEYGVDYLERVLSRAGTITDDVIIAVENRSE